MKRNAPAVHVDDIIHDSNAGGSFRWTTLYQVEGGPYGMTFRCPCGCGAMHGVGFDNRPSDWGGEAEKKQPRWHWDGNKEKPTLTPSLGLRKCRDDQTVGADGYHWHGFLRAGVFEEC
jgi:hypothetical protein